MKFKFLKVISASLILIPSLGHASIILLGGSAETNSDDTNTSNHILELGPDQQSSSSSRKSWHWGNSINNSDVVFSFLTDDFGTVTIEGSASSKGSVTHGSVSGWAKLLANIELTNGYNYDYTVGGSSDGHGRITSTSTFGTGFLDLGFSTNSGKGAYISPDVTTSGFLEAGLYDLTADASSYSAVSFLNGGQSAKSEAHFSLVFTPNASVAAVPEPSTLAIFALGIMGLASRRFKKQA
jgi:hypothetical protein